MTVTSNAPRRQGPQRPPAQPPRDEAHLAAANGHKPPPNDLAAEQGALGSMLINKEAAAEVAEALIADDFYRPIHSAIFSAILTMLDRGEAADAITLASALEKTGDLERVGGAPYLLTLMQAPISAANAGHYAKIVREKAMLRGLHEAVAFTTQLTDSAETSGRTLPEIIEEAQRRIGAVTDRFSIEAGADSWQPVDLTPALTGGVLSPPAALMARDDGVFLLYPGRIHSLSGEPEAGKTWVALVAVLQALEDHQHVLYLDFEDTPEGIVGRLLAMGAHPDRIHAYLHYVRPDRAIDTAGRRHIAALLSDHFFSIAVIDGVTEAMTLHGLDPYNNPDAAKFYEALPRFITRQPRAPAVLLIDHVPKDEDRPKRYAIGAQHKLAGLDGAAYMVDITKAFAPGQPGMSKIRVAKDRLGQVRKNAKGGVIAELHVSGHDEVVTVELRPPSDHRGVDGAEPSFRPTILMERVSRFVEINPGASRAVIEKSVQGKRDHVRLAIDLLHLEGYLHVAAGPRNSANHKSLKQFRNDLGEAA